MKLNLSVKLNIITLIIYHRQSHCALSRFKSKFFFGSLGFDFHNVPSVFWSSFDAVSTGVARICCKEGQSWKLGNGALTVDFRAGCSSCSMINSTVTNAVLIESCSHLRKLLWQTIHNTWIVGCQIYSKVN